ncbi:tail fiber assembly protein [Rouxiella badensis]|uniref:tail fiber assembly protein n=1 Tax=Rouxiella badensis TaxID=1646377 RepID=UPI001D134965|nr:tail fiber assembly protein [Rouxiella badensis]MCC3717989.1 tail fiber assembly protein [Rouxiella badensis]MCC3729996.1 tail fiber assembly protein [Rouxiella badensis]
MLFSLATQAFYDPNANYGANLPSDVLTVTADQYTQFYSAINDNKYIYKSGDDFLISDSRPDKYYAWDLATNTWVITEAMATKKQNDIAVALKQTASSEVTRSSTQISILSDKLELLDFSGAETSDSVTATLTLWKKYRIGCNSVVTGIAIELPVAPDA